MRLNTESKLPRLPANDLKVPVGGWAGFLPIIKSLPTEAELGCDNVLWYESKLKHLTLLKYTKEADLHCGKRQF